MPGVSEAFTPLKKAKVNEVNDGRGLNNAFLRNERPKTQTEEAHRKPLR